MAAKRYDPRLRGARAYRTSIFAPRLLCATTNLHSIQHVIPSVSLVPLYHRDGTVCFASGPHVGPPVRLGDRSNARRLLHLLDEHYARRQVYHYWIPDIGLLPKFHRICVKLGWTKFYWTQWSGVVRHEIYRLRPQAPSKRSIIAPSKGQRRHTRNIKDRATLPPPARPTSSPIRPPNSSTNSSSTNSQQQPAARLSLLHSTIETCHSSQRNTDWRRFVGIRRTYTIAIAMPVQVASTPRELAVRKERIPRRKSTARIFSELLVTSQRYPTRLYGGINTLFSARGSSDEAKRKAEFGFCRARQKASKARAAPIITPSIDPRRSRLPSNVRIFSPGAAPLLA